mmetsp:Transcript_81948/g.144717  ORF Transcript_81948/g.144717 Transcript_81948/m.144717 type:complete len:88 (-) Transcript_81948:184-447(-)
MAEPLQKLSLDCSLSLSEDEASSGDPPTADEALRTVKTRRVFGAPGKPHHQAKKECRKEGRSMANFGYVAVGTTAAAKGAVGLLAGV